MRRLLTITTLCLVCAACSSTLPEDNVQTSSSTSASGILVTGVAPNERTPTTIDSLEPLITKEPLSYRSLSGGVRIGKDNVPTLTVYIDEDCEYCREFSMTQLPLIQEKFVRQGLLSVQLFFAPRTDAGILMAKVALCAERQEVFGSAYPILQALPLSNAKDVSAFAKKAKLDEKKLTTCMKDTSLDTALFLNTEKLAGSRVPFFMLGDASWIGLKQKDVLMNDIEEFLQR